MEVVADLNMDLRRSSQLPISSFSINVNGESAILVLWVPFLLWHLGSPANITAYSLEDNELWLRHFLGLVSNVGGIIKYAERLVALRSASSEQLRDALYSEAERSCGSEMIRMGLFESTEPEPEPEPEMLFCKFGSILHKLYKWLVAPKLHSITSKSGIPKMAQYNVFYDFNFRLWFKICSPLINLVDTSEVASKYHVMTWVEANSDMKEFIYSGLKKELTGSLSCNFPETLNVEELDASLRPYLEHGKDESKQMPTSSTRAIFIFHIATKLVHEFIGIENEGPDGSSLRRKSSTLSDYMMYLVLVHPTMLPKDSGDMSAESFILDKRRPDRIRHELRGTNPNVLILKDEQSVSYKGYQFATQLKDRSNEIHGGVWKFLCDLRMIMLFDTAKNCSWKEHAVSLNGGELLTHVSLLLAHHGLSPYIRIQDADPNVNNIRAQRELQNKSWGNSYLLEPLWWAGMITMVVGDIANFAGYAFALAILVPPLVRHLHMSFCGKDYIFLGFLVVFCVLGSTTIVLHAPLERQIESITEVWDLATEPGLGWAESDSYHSRGPGLSASLSMRSLKHGEVDGFGEGIPLKRQETERNILIEI
ncbi:putative magnesium transporter NIPA2 [Hibiscus syriacus]|uniref:Magnesium transporter NIPA2 n=1 Tax=Hibiscus syriacus TaxID=106335 RepID=A0A6A3CII1_HIBSY|nr:putative magnesium transporter NIPA2 [Hibiscus syriacus]